MTSTTTPIGPSTLEELRSYTGTLYVRNLTLSTITCNTKDLQFELGAKDGPDSVAMMPKECLDVTGWVRLWQRGDIIISPDLEDEVMEADNRARLEQSARLAEINGQMEESETSKDLIEQTCLISGEKVWMNQAEIDDLVPPLAPRYKGQAHEFVASQVQQADGTVKTVFHRTQIGTT